MRAIVIGYGSIGRRHIENLLKLDRIELIQVYTKNVNCKKDFKHEKRIKIIDTLDDTTADFAIIANETYKHLETSVLLANKGINLFIEKPLSHNLLGVEVFENIVIKKNLKVFVAYNLRFFGALGYIKEQLLNNVIGTLYFAKIEVGQYLPFWRPERDYSVSYSAQKKKGGGVALDLSHELDYMCFLFGMPNSWRVIKTKVSDLKIDVDDVFEGLYKYKNNFICSVHMDYLQQTKKRDLRISGSKGTIICDFVKQSVKTTINGNEVSIEDEKLFDLNGTYMSELVNFIEHIENKSEPFISLKDGINVLKLIEDGNVKG